MHVGMHACKNMDATCFMTLPCPVLSLLRVPVNISLNYIIMKCDSIKGEVQIDKFAQSNN